MDKITKSRQPYHPFIRTGIFAVVLLIISEMYTHLALLQNQVFADASLIIAVVACFGLRRKAR